eukprot:1224659-Pyramimonas_sp.AAC.1
MQCFDPGQWVSEPLRSNVGSLVLCPFLLEFHYTSGKLIRNCGNVDAMSSRKVHLLHGPSRFSDLAYCL